MLMRLCRGLASLKLAVALIVGLAVVLAGTAYLAAQRGSEWAQWYVYDSPWFLGLLALLSVNVLAALLIHFPWKLRQIGFVLSHVGLLVLLAGALQTYREGIEGTLSLREGQEGDRLRLTERSVITVLQPDRGKQRSTEFVFRPGPVDWPEQRPLDFGTADGLGVKVLKFYRHARENVAWVADDRDYQGPALQLLLAGPTGKAVTESWLTANLFGGEAVIGPTRYELLPLPWESMSADLQPPPTDELGQAGVLSMHWRGEMFRVKVDDHLRQKVPVGDSGLSVELTEYLPNARPKPDGHFFSQGDTPKNPLLELKVYEPGREEPTRQIAFARRPLLTLDGVHGRELPVKFWYHHPVVTTIPGAVFMQTPADKLYCRAAVNGTYTPTREITPGVPIALDAGFSVTVVQHLPRARKEVTFESIATTVRDADESEAAALVELSIDGENRQAWLRRGDRQDDPQSVPMARGLIDLLFDYDTVPLGCTVQLKELTRRPNPNGSGDDCVASTLHVRGLAQGPQESQPVALDQPLTVGKFTLYQSGSEASPGQGKKSVFLVTSDPGRQLKYVGGLLLSLGLALMLVIRSQRGGTLLALIVGMLLSTSATAAVADEPVWEWEQWRYLPAQEGGRWKPLDTLARNLLHTLSNRTTFLDPETHRELDANTLYLVMLFDWQGWDRARSPQQPGSPGSRTDYFLLHQPDKWDKAPLLTVRSLPLREALHMAKGQLQISPLELSQAKLELPDVNETRPFLQWAERKRMEESPRHSAFEKQALELAGKFWAYQEHRMGQRLAVLPVQGSDGAEWISLAYLLRADFDDVTDSTRQMRAAQQQFQAARKAYRAGSADDFSSASAAFLETVREFGPQLGPYAVRATIDLEIANNLAAPFHWAWPTMLVAVGCLGVSLTTGRKRFLLTGRAIFAAALIVMLVGMAVRVMISGRAPLTSMYESVVFLGLGAAVFGLLLELLHRDQYALLVAACVATIALMLADLCSAALDPSLPPLQPVLPSNFWLITHAVTITLSYAAFALALGFGNIVLGHYLVGREDQMPIDRLVEALDKLLQWGTFLLVVGVLASSVWADYARGRFWNWDPQEVWTLVALLGYVATLHARRAGWLKPWGLAALSVLCFAPVVMAWYGVN